MFVNKWNTKYGSGFATKEASVDGPNQMLNKGTSFLVAPHNLSFNKRAMEASKSNHTKVLGSIEKILAKHNAKEAKAMRGMTEEMAKKRMANKPNNIIRTEAFYNQINSNKAGQ